MRYSFDNRFFTYLNNIERKLRAMPLNLGGAPTGSGGGAGGPPGGFVGYLPQYRVAYDLSEIAASGTPASGMSLVDNLNHIRYRIEQVEGVTGSGIIIEDDNVLIDSGVTVLNFGTDLEVINDGGNHVTINCTASGTTGSGGGEISVEEDNILVASGVTILNIGNSVDATDDGAGQVTVELPSSITITNTRVKSNNIFSVGASVTHTISGGAITLTASHIALQGEGDTTDTLLTINGGADGDIIIIRHYGGEYTLTIDGDGTGNILTVDGLDFSMGTGQFLFFHYDEYSSMWYELGRHT